MSEPRDLAEVVIGMMCDREGFDDWWFQIDEEVQEDILDELAELFMTWNYIPKSEYIM